MKKIQFYRNEHVYTSDGESTAVQVAKSAIEQLANVSDGEIILARYQESQDSDVKTMLCVYQDDGTDHGWTFICDYDAEDYYSKENVDTFISDIENIIEDNELVTAAALADLDERVDAAGSVVETDPIFTASPAYGITSANITEWSEKKHVQIIVEIGENDIATFTDLNGNTLQTEDVLQLLRNVDIVVDVINFDDERLYTPKYARYSLSEYWIYQSVTYHQASEMQIEYDNGNLLCYKTRVTILNEENAAYFVPYTRKVNGKALSSDITLRTSDIGTEITTKSASSTVSINPYVFNNLGTVSQSITISFNTSAEIANCTKEYTIRFVAGSGCNITLPNGTLYANGATPTYTVGHTYEINVVNGCAVVGEFY